MGENVAVQRCQAMGESVNYQVNMNKNKSRSTRLLFCSTGVLLRKMQGYPALHVLTDVLLDDVHERPVETDFLLLWREILPTHPTLKVVLLFGTLDVKNGKRIQHSRRYGIEPRGEAVMPVSRNRARLQRRLEGSFKTVIFPIVIMKKGSLTQIMPVV